MSRCGIAAKAAGAALAAGLVCSGLVLVKAGGSSVERGPVWRETKWPFLFDPWGPGRAFHCPASACGADLDVYIRPKVGFCNCSVGVADDDEIDRVGDLDLIGPHYAPLAPGRPVTVGSLRGRARSFVVEDRSKSYATGIALSKKCDALVAMFVSRTPITPERDRMALDLLAGGELRGWTEASVDVQ